MRDSYLTKRSPLVGLAVLVAVVGALLATRLASRRDSSPPPATLLSLRARLSKPPLQPEAAERDAFRDSVRARLDRHEFKALEELAHELIVTDPRFTCGVPKLVEFYDTFWPHGEDLSRDADLLTASLNAWVAESPRSYVPLAGLARIEQWRAGNARGTAWANDVTPEQWRGHAKYIARAKAFGEKALGLSPQDPMFYGLLIGLCRDLNCPRAEVDSYLAQALAINPRFDGMYVSMANYLMPRWNGSPDEFASFVSSAADANKELGEIVYARVATTALIYEKKDLPQVIPGLRWERIKAGLLEIDRRYPNSARTQHLLALSAWVYQDRATAKAAFLRLGTTLTPDVKAYWSSDTDYLTAYRWSGEQPR